MSSLLQPFKPFIEELPKPFRNKYSLTAILFFIWICLFDRNNLWTQWSLQRAVQSLEEEKKTYIKKLKEVNQERLTLEADKEKFAREHFFMHKKDEDVYIIIDK
ncbi:MAG: hypothetical protein KBA06_05730 [Saprospiraceae bacterium]|nr:hypothetical protein [Saprospiraceae bacterium]